MVIEAKFCANCNILRNWALFQFGGTLVCMLRFCVYVYIHVTCRLHAISLNMARCFASLFSRNIPQNFHSQRLYIQQNHQTHYNWSECQPQIESKYFLFVSYVKMYSICQITTAARVCHGFAKYVAIIHSNCYLNLLWGKGVMINTYQQALSSASYS